MTDDDLTAVLLELERRGWQSLCDGTGADFYRSAMTEDGVLVLADGAVLDRDAVVAGLREAPVRRCVELEDVRLVGGGPDRALNTQTPVPEPVARRWRRLRLSTDDARET
jgi:hypothetical protein